MERNPETTRLMLLGLQRLATDVMEDSTRGRGPVQLLPVGETGRSSDGLVPRYAGCPVSSLVLESCFPEVAWLLLHGELPNVEFLADFQSLLSIGAVLPEPVRRVVEELPLHASDSEAVRAGLAVLTAFDPQLEDDGETTPLAKATRLLATAPSLIGARRGWSTAAVDDGRALDDDTTPYEPPSYAGRVHRELTGTDASPAVERAIDAMLIVLAEQAGDPSTLAARIVASNGGDVYASVGAAVAAVDTRAGEDVCRDIRELVTRAEEVADVSTWFVETFDATRPLPGFDREQDDDVRVRCLDGLCRELARDVGYESFESAARVVERSALDVFGARPTLSWPIARLLMYCGIESESFGSLLQIARIAGWAAHALEESTLGRRLAPIWEPCTTDLDYVPLDDRG